MPHVIVKLHPGRSIEQKFELAEKIIDNIAEVIECDKRLISVAMEDVPPEEWFEKVYGPDIEGRLDQLIIKPGYGPLKKK